MEDSKSSFEVSVHGIYEEDAVVEGVAILKETMKNGAVYKTIARQKPIQEEDGFIDNYLDNLSFNPNGKVLEFLAWRHNHSVEVTRKGAESFDDRFGAYLGEGEWFEWLTTEHGIAGEKNYEKYSQLLICGLIK